MSFIGGSIIGPYPVFSGSGFVITFTPWIDEDLWIDSEIWID